MGACFLLVASASMGLENTALLHQTEAGRKREMLFGGAVSVNNISFSYIFLINRQG
jgi:hypothetical protein